MIYTEEWTDEKYTLEELLTAEKVFKRADIYWSEPVVKTEKQKEFVIKLDQLLTDYGMEFYTGGDFGCPASLDICDNENNVISIKKITKPKN